MTPHGTTPASPVGETPALSFEQLVEGFLEDYALHGYRSLKSACSRVAQLRRFFGRETSATITTAAIRAYQCRRRAEGAATGTVNRETSSLSRMFRLAVHHGLVETMPTFPQRLLENPPRDGFFEHVEYLRVRAQLPSPYQDLFDFAYYSGWRRREITELTWAEVDDAGGVIRLSPRRSKTQTGRLLPISTPLAAVLARRRARQRPGDARVFQRDGITVRAWRRAWPDACRRAGVPHRLLHDCRRTAVRNLIRAGVPERVAMLLSGHKTRCVFDRYNIVNEQELLRAGHRLVAYVTQQTPVEPDRLD